MGLTVNRMVWPTTAGERDIGRACESASRDVALRT